jgi:opacity protein-like surface antigen
MGNRKSRKNFFFLLVLALALMPMAAAAAVLEIDDQEGAKDAEVTFTIAVNSPPTGTDNLAMDMTFEPDVLRYVDADFSGSLLESWDTKQVTNPEPGVLRLNASTGHNAINGGAKGTLVKIKFTVVGDESFDLAIKNLKSGVSSWDTKGGNFKFFKIPST